MSNPVDITGYEVVFGVRTGVTVLLPKNHVFDIKDQNTVSFSATASSTDIEVRTPQGAIKLKNFRKDHFDESAARGYIMFYEMEDDEVVRCTKAVLAPK